MARELSGAEAGPGQPRNTNLRRAVSTAYYALFHRLALDIARNAVAGASDAEVHGVARHVAHAAIRDVCEWVDGNTPKKHLADVVDRLRHDDDVTNVAQAFVRLHEQREKADYDHTADFTRAGVVTSVERAAKAVDLAYAARDGDTFRTFLGLIALRTRIGQD